MYIQALELRKRASEFYYTYIQRGKGNRASEFHYTYSVARRAELRSEDASEVSIRVFLILMDGSEHIFFASDPYLEK